MEELEITMNEVQHIKKNKVIVITFLLIMLLTTVIGCQSDSKSNSEPDNLAVEPDRLPTESKIVDKIDVFAIEINCKPVVYLETELEAQMVLDELFIQYSMPEALNSDYSFKEEVDIIKYKMDTFDVEQFQTSEKALAYIREGSDQQIVYEVKLGDYLLRIAELYGISVFDIEDENPELDLKTFTVGTKLNITVSVPLISVYATHRIQRLDPLQFGVDEVVKTDEYFVGEYKVKQDGVAGEAQNLVDIHFQNGRVIGETVVSTVVLKEPVNKVIYQGTKPLSSKK